MVVGVRPPCLLVEGAVRRAPDPRQDSLLDVAKYTVTTASAAAAVRVDGVTALKN